MRTLKSIASVTVLLIAAALPVRVASAVALQVQTKNGVSYVTGGVSDDERAALNNMARDFNLKVTLTIKTGEFLGDAAVHIRDTQGQAVLDVTTDGPLFYAKLPPGTYTVTIDRQGKELQKTAQVTSGRQTDLMFSWTQE